MSKKLIALLETKKEKGEKLLSIFITAGFPDPDACVEIILILAEAGIDFLELGLPFSDPIADGPVIQSVSQQVLEQGFEIAQIFDIVQQVRKCSPIPILIMGYLNPLFHMGIPAFLKRTHSAGADGLIIPDWPPEESLNYLPLLQSLDLDLIHLIAPNTPRARIREIDALTTAFLYCVAYTGVTGRSNQMPADTRNFFCQLKKNVVKPLIIGFGVKNREEFINFSQYADGVIIGSAFLELIKRTDPGERKNAVEKFVQSVLSKR